MRLPILDVQSATDYARGHVPGSVSIPLEELPQRTHELPVKGSELEVHDPDPWRRKQAQAWLRMRGYEVRLIEEDMLLISGSADPNQHLWQPSDFLVQMMDRFAPEHDLKPLKKHVLDIGCGSGREAVWLAMRGYVVTAIDVLPDALDKAQDLARRHGVNIRTQHQDVRKNPTLPQGPYQYILMLRFVHRPLATAITQALQPGGYFIGEAFVPEPNHPQSSARCPCLLPEAWPSLFPGLQEQAAHVHRSREQRGMTGWIGRKP